MKLVIPRFALRPVLLILLLASLPLSNARALDATTFTGELDALVVEGNALLAGMRMTTLSPLTMASQTSQLAAGTADYLAEVTAVYNQVLDTSSTLTLTSTMLGSLEALAMTAGALAQESMRLSAEMSSLAALTMSSTLDSSLGAMLKLSADIGSMANRIGEMADRILVMADNIGIMADRILMTQVIQNGNIGLMVDAMLVTQQNLLTLAARYDL